MNGNDQEILEEVLLNYFRNLDQRGQEAVLQIARIEFDYLHRAGNAPVSL